MRNPVVAALLASAFLSLSANATDLLQIYQDALANDLNMRAPVPR
jgi:outer membrane protein